MESEREYFLLITTRKDGLSERRLVAVLWVLAHRVGYYRSGGTDRKNYFLSFVDYQRSSRCPLLVEGSPSDTEINILFI